MEKRFTIEGEVRSAEIWNDSETGKFIGMKYQVETKVGKEKVQPWLVISYDKEKIYKAGDSFPQTAVKPVISEYDGLHVEFRTIGNFNNGNGGVKTETKKTEVKV